MTRLIFIRHGETSTNIDNKLHRYNDPEKLTEVGLEQMRALSKKLEEYSPTAIFASGEKRTLQSAELIAASLKIPLKIDDGLRERNWGDYSGKPWTEVQAILDKMPLQERYTFLPPGGESWQASEKRLIGAVDRLIKDGGDSVIAVVTHGGAIRILMPYLLNKPKEESFKYSPDNASLTVFDYSDERFSLVPSP